MSFPTAGLPIYGAWTQASEGSADMDTRFVQHGINVKAYPYLATGDGVANDTVAIQAAITAAEALAAFSPGMRVLFPPGKYLVTDTITINSDRVHLQGLGKYSPQIVFNPTSAKACFKFQKTNTAQIIFQCSIRNLSGTGQGTQQKIFLDLYDSSEFLIEEVTTNTWTGNSGSSATPSIALRTAGRELLRLAGVDFYADRPIHITRNANAPSLSADHFTLGKAILAPQVATEASILIDGDVGMANFTVNDHAWVGGKYGLKYSSGAAPATALLVMLNGFRFEQPGDTTGYAVSWEAPAQNLLVQGNMGGIGTPTNGGLFIRNVRKTTLLNALYTGAGAAANALNADATCDEIWLINATFADLSTVTLAGLEEVFSMPKRNTNAPTPSTAYYANTSTGNRLLKINGIANGSLPAGGAANDRSIGIDTTNHRLVYYDNGTRYFMPIGTAF